MQNGFSSGNTFQLVDNWSSTPKRFLDYKDICSQGFLIIKIFYSQGFPSLTIVLKISSLNDFFLQGFLLPRIPYPYGFYSKRFLLSKNSSPNDFLSLTIFPNMSSSNNVILQDFLLPRIPYHQGFSLRKILCLQRILPPIISYPKEFSSRFFLPMIPHPRIFTPKDFLPPKNSSCNNFSPATISPIVSFFVYNSTISLRIYPGRHSANHCTRKIATV